MLRFVLLKFKNALLSYYEYKVNFFMYFFLQIAYFFAYYIFIFVIYQYIPVIVGVNFKEAVLYIIVFDLYDCFTSFIFFDVENSIFNGKLTIALTKPINSVLYLLDFSITNLIFIGFDIALIIIYFFYYSIAFYKIFILLFYIILSFPILLFIFMAISSLSLHFEKVGPLRTLYTSLYYSFQQFPVTIVKKPYFYIFILLAPFVFFSAYFPVIAVTRNLPIIYYLYAFIGIVFFDFLAYLVFRLIYSSGMKKFSSYGG